MQYIADSNGYLKEVSFGCSVSCNGSTCINYIGATPSGYSSLEEWYRQECDNLHQWKISGGNLVKDSSATVEALSNVDFVVDHGTTGVWTWRKWSSGIAEMWGVFEPDVLDMSSPTWGALYTASWMGSTENKNGRKYPFAFVAEPFVNATPMCRNANFWIATDSGNDTGTRLTHAPAYQCVRASDATLRNPKISYYVVGKWK
jgi:hypothetical protein